MKRFSACNVVRLNLRYFWLFYWPGRGNFVYSISSSPPHLHRIFFFINLCYPLRLPVSRVMVDIFQCFSCNWRLGDLFQKLMLLPKMIGLQRNFGGRGTGKSTISNSFTQIFSRIFFHKNWNFALPGLCLLLAFSIIFKVLLMFPDNWAGALYLTLNLKLVLASSSTMAANQFLRVTQT